ncbi:AAA family ATPase [Alteromonas stellipolaris]|uniref:NadR/Ttd14 AAA domain-containing protein n=1 Tax=Alteromonas stellipolaris TaxID=233316 RepID=A0ABM5YQI7_9ALTE|nr:hypothetical protein AVL57_00160 [Alteromonas stellipolaris]
MYHNSIRRFVALSGWEGAGKSEGVKHIARQLGFFMFPEIARIMFPINEKILQKPLNELSELTFSGYVTGHHTCVANRIQKAVFDRCILDPLTYQALYSPEKQLNLREIQGYIHQFNDEFEQDTLYDDIVLLSHPKDAGFIEEVVFKDKDRKYSTSIEQYLSDAKAFEEHFQVIAAGLKGVTNRIHLIPAFPENPEVLSDLTLVAADLYKPN